MSYYFPQEIWDDILHRLPSKSLCRFLSVSKSWYARITTQSFISSNLNYNLNCERNSHFLLRVFHKKIEKFSFYPYEDTVCSTPESLAVPSLTLNPPLQTPVGYHRIVGHSNGLICLTDDMFCDSADIVLWNPSIRKYMTLPDPEILPDCPFMFMLGFGVDSSTGDFKVVRIVYQAETGGVDLRNLRYGLPPLVEVYSLRTGMWRRIEDASVNRYLRPLIWSQAYVNSRAHWANDRRYGDNENLIVSFDMNDEVFGEILLPEDLAHNNLAYWVVTVSMECLAVVGVDITGHCFVWVMSEYGNTESWTKLYMVDVKLPSQLVGFRKNGDILMQMIQDQFISQLALFVPNNESVVELGIFGSGRAMYADKYVESLVLIDAPNFEGVNGGFHNQLLEGIRIERQLSIN